MLLRPRPLSGDGRPKLGHGLSLCGSSIYSTGKDDPSVDMQIRTGILIERATLAPLRQIWRSSALDWVTNLQSVPCLDRQ